MKSMIINMIVMGILMSLVSVLSAGNVGMQDSLEGKYVLTSGEAMGITMDAHALEEAGLGEFYLDFSNDGTVKGEVMGDTGEGTYEVDGDTVSITIDGETIDFEKDGAVLFIETEEEGMTVRLNFEKE